MLDNRKVVAFIPARGGSKGLPGKNVRSLCGKPLIEHAIIVAKQSRHVDRVVVSTDCPDIASIGLACGAEIHQRPAALATDDALVADAIRHFLQRDEGGSDCLVLLEATSPLRTRHHVDGCIEQLVRDGLDSVATFSRAEPPPTRLWKIVDGAVETYVDNANPWLPRQQQDEAIFLNGLVYVVDTRAFLGSTRGVLFFGKSAAVMTEGVIVDIDTEEDFVLAGILMEKRNESC